MILVCRYWAVVYFVSRYDPAQNSIEPVLPVEDEAHGELMIRWLTRFPLALRQYGGLANDNEPAGGVMSAACREAYGMNLLDSLYRYPAELGSPANQ